jgi:hypothetical protein
VFGMTCFLRSIFFGMEKGIPVLNMDDRIPVRGRSKLHGMTYTNLHFYRVEFFYVVIDKICVEMDHLFCEVSMEILESFSCLSPKNTFSMLMWTSLLVYQLDFSNEDHGTISGQLDNYIHHVRIQSSFSTCTNLESVAPKVDEIGKNLVFLLVYTSLLSWL